MPPKQPKIKPIPGERARKSALRLDGKDTFAQSFYRLRGERVILDTDLAKMFVVPVSRVRAHVHEDSRRFPDDFAFQLTEEDVAALKEQGAKNIRAGKDNPPWAFTEHGVAMLTTVFSTRWAVMLGIQILRAFKRARTDSA